MRQLGIPTVVDGLVQQAINQVLPPPSTKFCLAETISVSVRDVAAMMHYAVRKTSSIQITNYVVDLDLRDSSIQYVTVV